MKSFILACLVFASSSAFAVGGLSLAAVPTAIDIERSGGFMVYGEFGNVAGCTTSDRMYIQSSHPQYNQIYSSTLAAMMAGKKIQAYIQACTPVAWYSVDSVTYNTLIPNSTFYIKN